MGHIITLKKSEFMQTTERIKRTKTTTTIDSSKNICTIINVFTVDPKKTGELFELLKEATEQIMSRQPGYISANLHISHEKKHLTNYAQWETMDDFMNMVRNPEVQSHMKKAEALCSDIKPVTYSKIWSHSNRDEKNFS